VSEEEEEAPQFDEGGAGGRVLEELAWRRRLEAKLRELARPEPPAKHPAPSPFELIMKELEEEAEAEEEARRRGAEGVEEAFEWPRRPAEEEGRRLRASLPIEAFPEELWDEVEEDGDGGVEAEECPRCGRLTPSGLGRCMFCGAWLEGAA
jgi:hypothetical protein